MILKYSLLYGNPSAIADEIKKLGYDCDFKYANKINNTYATIILNLKELDNLDVILNNVNLKIRDVIRAILYLKAPIKLDSKTIKLLNVHNIELDIE